RILLADFTYSLHLKVAYIPCSNYELTSRTDDYCNRCQIYSILAACCSKSSKTLTTFRLKFVQVGARSLRSLAFRLARSLRSLASRLKFVRYAHSPFGLNVKEIIVLHPVGNPCNFNAIEHHRTELS